MGCKKVTYRQIRAKLTTVHVDIENKQEETMYLERDRLQIVRT